MFVLSLFVVPNTLLNGDSDAGRKLWRFFCVCHVVFVAIVFGNQLVGFSSQQGQRLDVHLEGFVLGLYMYQHACSRRLSTRSTL